MENTNTKQLKELKGVVVCSSRDRLGSVLSGIKASNEPAFVFDDGVFVGLVSLYHTLFKNRYPYTTLISHCLVKPPHIVTNTSLYEIAQYMLETELYTLPVFDDGQISKIISADIILKYIASQEKLLSSVCDAVKPHDPVTAPMSATVKDILTLMRKKKVGRIILINTKGKLVGIVSRRDLQDAFTAKTDRQRYTSRAKSPVSSSFDEEVSARGDAPVMEFAKTSVTSAENTLSLPHIVHRMLASKRHSIVITRDAGVPVGLISYHDILKAFTGFKPKADIHITWTKQLDWLPEDRLMAVYDLIYRSVAQLHKRLPVLRAAIHIHQDKNAAGHPKSLINVGVHVLFVSGVPLHAKADEWGIDLSVKTAFKRLMREIGASDRQKHDMRARKLKKA